MDKNFKTIIVVQIFLLILINFLFVYNYSKRHFPTRTFSVSGESKEVIVPNIAKINIGLVTEGSDVIKIQKENSEKFNKVIQFLKNKGVKEEDIKTENYTISPKYDFTNTRNIIGYTINQSVSIKIRELNKISEILDGAILNGANNVYGPDFIVDKDEIDLSKARERAMANAKKKAREISKLAGFKLGNIVNVSDYVEMPSNYYSLSPGMGGENLSKIEPGSQEIKMVITLTYEIK